MSEITSKLLEVSVDTDATVEIDSKLPEPQLDITKSITAEIQPENYVLTSGGIYTGNMTGATPTWLLNAIQQQLTTGDGNVTSVLNDMQLLLDDLQLGVNQAISQIENTNVSMSALETSLASRINGNQAAILDVYATRVTADEAQAIATTAIGATFGGNVDAYIGNLASVYTAPGSATATNIATLQASYNDQTARIDTVEEVAVSAAKVIRAAVPPTLASHPTLKSGDYWIDTSNSNLEYVWNGALWEETTTGSAEQAVVWSANASKLITSPDGSVTGWSFGDGSNTQSYFKVQATNFSISDGTTGYTPFLIDGTDIKFNGKVSFSNVTDAPTTAINLMPAEYTTFTAPTLPVVQSANCYLERRTDAAWVKYGGSTLMFWATAADAYVYLNDNAKEVYNVKAPVGASVIISAWVKVNAGTGAIQLYAQESNGTHYGTSKTIPINTWTRIYLVHTMVTSSMRIRIDSDGYVGTNVATSIDGVMVEINNGSGLPSDFTDSANGLATATLSNVTTIDGGKITTGSITASQIAANAISTDQIALGTALVNGSVKSSNYSWNGSTSTIPTGFGLFTNTTDPGAYGYNMVGGNIYGGQIVGATILLRNEAGKLAYPAFTVAVGSVMMYASDSNVLYDIVLNPLVPYNDTGTSYSRMQSATSSIYFSDVNMGYNLENAGDSNASNYNTALEHVYAGNTLIRSTNECDITYNKLPLVGSFLSWYNDTSILAGRAEGLFIQNIRINRPQLSLAGTGPITIRLINRWWGDSYYNGNTKDAWSLAHPPGSITYTKSFSLNMVVTVPNQAIVF